MEHRSALSRLPLVVLACVLALTLWPLAHGVPNVAASTPTPRPRVARLSPGQPWLLVDSDRSPCGAGVPARRLLAFDTAGLPTEYDQGVTLLMPRVGAPPLLATCASDGTATLVDSADWKRIPLPLEPAVVINQLAVSPDGRRAVLQTRCWREAACDDGGTLPDASYLVDLRTGGVAPASTIPVSGGGGGPYSDHVSVSLLGWGRAGVYFATGGKGWWALALADPDRPHIPARELARNSGYTLNTPRDLLAAVGSVPGALSITLRDVHQNTSQMIEQAAWLSTPTFSPDGSALVYFRADTNISALPAPRLELVIFDTMRRTKQVIAGPWGTPLERQVGDSPNTATFWSRDSQRVITITMAPGGAPQIALLTRDGGRINSVPLPDGALLGITADDTVMLHGPEGAISWLSLRPSAAPSLPPITPPGTQVYGVYLPGSGQAPLLPAPSPTHATPQVTVLPSLRPAPTQLPASPAPVLRLSEVTSRTVLIDRFPATNRVLSFSNGALSAQALGGGPAVYLGGDTHDSADLVWVSRDETRAVVRTRQVVSRVSLTSGGRVPLTPPLANGATGISFAEVSGDGQVLVYGVTSPKPDAWKDELRDEEAWTTAVYSVPLAGGAPLRLTTRLASNTEISGLMITRDSRYVVYAVGEPAPDFRFRSDMMASIRTLALFSVPIRGGAATRLATSLDRDDPIGAYGLSPDSRYLLYQPRSASALWRVPLTGGTPLRLDTASRDQGCGFAFMADPRSVLCSTTAGVSIIPLAGGSPTRLTGRPGMGPGPYSLRLTPDETRAIVLTDRALYSVPTDGGRAVQLTTLPPISSASDQPLLVTPARIIYQRAGAISSVGLAGGTPVQLTPAADPGITVTLERVSADQRFVVYTVDHDAERTRMVFRVPVDGGTPVMLLAGAIDDTVLFHIVGEYAIGVEGWCLYAARLADGVRLQLSPGGRAVVEPPLISADGRHVVYLAGGTGGSAAYTNELYVATLAGSRR